MKPYFFKVKDSWICLAANDKSEAVEIVRAVIANPELGKRLLTGAALMGIPFDILSEVRMNDYVGSLAYSQN